MGVFAFPIKLTISTNVPVIGNGMTLGLTNGTDNVGVGRYPAGISAFHPAIALYGTKVGTTVPNAAVNGSLGITADPTKSGITASLSGIDIGEVNSFKLGKYILKY